MSTFYLCIIEFMSSKSILLRYFHLTYVPYLTWYTPLHCMYCALPDSAALDFYAVWICRQKSLWREDNKNWMNSRDFAESDFHLEMDRMQNRWKVKKYGGWGEEDGDLYYLWLLIFRQNQVGHIAPPPAPVPPVLFDRWSNMHKNYFVSHLISILEYKFK